MTNGLSVIGYVLMAHDAYITCALWSSTCLDDQGDDVAWTRSMSPTTSIRTRY